MASDLKEDQTAQIRERRKRRRKALLSSAKIVCRNDGGAMLCVVLNISEGGAKLRPADMPSCPDKFTLQLGDSHTRECEVVWRNQAFLGVRFVAAWRELNSFAELISRRNRS